MAPAHFRRWKPFSEGSSPPTPGWRVGGVIGAGGWLRQGYMCPDAGPRALPSLLQEELEHLNQANEEINRVELQLDVSEF